MNFYRHIFRFPYILVTKIYFSVEIYRYYLMKEVWLSTRHKFSQSINNFGTTSSRTESFDSVFKITEFPKPSWGNCVESVDSRARLGIVGLNSRISSASNCVENVGSRARLGVVGLNSRTSSVSIPPQILAVLYLVDVRHEISMVEYHDILGDIPHSEHLRSSNVVVWVHLVGKPAAWTTKQWLNKLKWVALSSIVMSISSRAIDWRSSSLD